MEKNNHGLCYINKPKNWIELILYILSAVHEAGDVYRINGRWVENEA